MHLMHLFPKTTGSIAAFYSESLFFTSYENEYTSLLLWFEPVPLMA